MCSDLKLFSSGLLLWAKTSFLHKEEVEYVVPYMTPYGYGQASPDIDEREGHAEHKGVHKEVYARSIKDE